MKVFAFIDAQKAEFDIKTLCQVCSVSRSAFYDWVAAMAAGPDQELWDEAVLANHIFDIWKRSRGRYGVPRVTAQLCRQGCCVNHKRVERVMAELGIAGRCGRRKMRTTIRDPRELPAVDLVKRVFGRDGIDQLWVGDLTYIPTREGWLYVASVLDACSRRLLGWSIADHMRTEICTDALRAAVATRGRARLDGVVFHSDHGCQYTSNDYKTICADMHIVQLMGTVGDSYDNAMAESFWASLKCELIDDAYYATKEEARAAVFEWLMWYNRERLHSSIGYQPPEEYEDQLLTQPSSVDPCPLHGGMFIPPERSSAVSQLGQVDSPLSSGPTTSLNKHDQESKGPDSGQRRACPSADGSSVGRVVRRTARPGLSLSRGSG